MSLEQFTEFLEAALRARHVLFTPEAVQRFVREVWPEARLDPDVSRWATEFINRGEADVLA
jgi:hypothetical protein